MTYYQRTLSLRLKRLIKQHLSSAFGPASESMLGLCIDATYRDCIDAGIADVVLNDMAKWRRLKWEGQKRAGA